MKITIEPTEDQRDKEFPFPAISLEIPGDDWEIHTVGDLIRDALIAWGFAEASVSELIAPR